MSEQPHALPGLRAAVHPRAGAGDPLSLEADAVPPVQARADHRVSGDPHALSADPNGLRAVRGREGHVPAGADQVPRLPADRSPAADDALSTGAHALPAAAHDLPTVRPADGRSAVDALPAAADVLPAVRVGRDQHAGGSHRVPADPDGVSAVRRPADRAAESDGVPRGGDAMPERADALSGVFCMTWSMAARAWSFFPWTRSAPA